MNSVALLQILMGISENWIWFANQKNPKLPLLLFADGVHGAQYFFTVAGWKIFSNILLQ